MSEHYPKVLHLIVRGLGGSRYEWLLSEQEFGALKLWLEFRRAATMGTPEFAKTARAAAGRRPSLRSGPAKSGLVRQSNILHEAVELPLIRRLIDDVRARFPEATDDEIEATAMREWDTFYQVGAKKIIEEQIQLFFDSAAAKRGLMRVRDPDTGEVNFVPKGWTDVYGMAAPPPRIM